MYQVISTHFHHKHVKQKRGVMTPKNDSVSLTFHDQISDPESYYLNLICKFNSALYTIANIYAPNTHQQIFFNKLLTKLKKLSWGSLLICRDFNMMLAVIPSEKEHHIMA